MGIKELLQGFFQLIETKEDILTGKAERAHRLVLWKKASENTGPQLSELIIERRKTKQRQ